MMKSHKVRFLMALSICSVLGIFLFDSTSNGQSTPRPQQGLVVDGLQMSIRLSDSNKVDSPAFQVVIENTAEKDVTLNLGTMLANGQVQRPDNIRLNLKDETGIIRKLHFFSGPVSGRVDDYTVPLRSGSSYSLSLKLEQLWSQNTNEFSLNLKSGKYQVAAEFEGGGAKTHNLDNKGIALMNFWKGRVQSNTLSFQR